MSDNIIANVEQFQKDFENYVKKFEQIRELAGRLKTSPGILVEMFFGIGLEALKHTESILQREFNSKINELFPVEAREEIKKEMKIILDSIREAKWEARLK